MLSEPGPEPVRGRRYEEVTFCKTSQFILIHSWTNGETLPIDQPQPAGAGVGPCTSLGC